VVVKSHGGTDAKGFAHAVDVAMDMATHGFTDRIRADIARIGLDKRGKADKNGDDTSEADRLETASPPVPGPGAAQPE